MTAAGKINASNVQAGDRIVVRIERNDAGLFVGLHESRTKTHADDLVVRVTGKTFRNAQGPYEARGKYVIETTAGAFEAAPIQTMILAPEDAAGIKRAHAEAIVEDEEFSRVRAAMAEIEAEEAALLAEAKDQAERTAALEARVDEAFPPAVHAELAATLAEDTRITEAQHAEVNERHRAHLASRSTATQMVGRPLRLAEAATPAAASLATLARVAQGLGRTLRPILEDGVRQAREIPEGRRRHGQVKARRDALRHARKLELANL
jgi:hypothetical protein